MNDVGRWKIRYCTSLTAPASPSGCTPLKGARASTSSSSAINDSDGSSVAPLRDAFSSSSSIGETRVAEVTQVVNNFFFQSHQPSESF
mgnify:CR=1 FL=1